MSFWKIAGKVLRGTLLTIWYILNVLAWLSLAFMINVIFFIEY